MAKELLREYAANTGIQLRVDREKCVVHGVKILGLTSRNDGGKRMYLHEAVVKAVPLYEGAAVFVNHSPKGQNPPYEARNGRLVNVEARQDGLYADHHYNPKHPITEQYLWDAENAPGNVGFSQDADGTVRREKDKVIVESIETVRSVDLVARPASVKGLFEDEEITDPELLPLAETCLSAMTDARAILFADDSIQSKTSRLLEVLSAWTADLAGSAHKESSAMEWKDVTVESLKENRKDLVEVLTGTDATSQLAAEVKALKEAQAAKDAELKALKEEAAAAKAKEAAAAKELAINEELKLAKVDATNKTLCSESFMAQLRAAADSTARKALIEDRLSLVKMAGVPSGAAPFASISDPGTAQPGATAAETIARLR